MTQAAKTSLGLRFLFSAAMILGPDVFISPMGIEMLGAAAPGAVTKEMGEEVIKLPLI